MSLAFDLPRALEASAPPEARGLARDEISLLVSDARSNNHEVYPFNSLADFLNPGDLLVMNDSATIPAALDARYQDEGFPLHLSTRIAQSLWLAEPRSGTRFAPGDRLSLPEEAALTLLAPFGGLRPRLWYAHLSIGDDSASYLNRNGRAITYGYLQKRWPISYYQSIFAKEPGSVEMPSAARPFSLRTLRTLRGRNIDIATITLHCSVASPESHEPPIMEWMNVSPRAAEAIKTARARNKRVVAVGTTVVRALETATDDGGQPVALRGWTGARGESEAPSADRQHALNGIPRTCGIALRDARSIYVARVLARLIRRSAAGSLIVARVRGRASRPTVALRLA